MTLLTGDSLKRLWPHSLVPVLLIAGMGLLFFAKLVIHPSWVLYSDFSDLLAYQTPHIRFLVGSWQETGELPLWCPYSFAGMPFIHDIQVGAFYPPHAFLYRLPQEWIGPALSWLIVVHVILAGWTMFAYARHQDLCPTCSMVAAVGYMFAGKWLLAPPLSRAVRDGRLGLAAHGRAPFRGSDSST